MSSPSAIALTGFIAWALLLLVLMEIIRTALVASGKVAANGFAPDNAGLSPFMQRLARAHANCLEGLPIFGGLLLVALVTGHTSITDPLAYWFLGAGCFSLSFIWFRCRRRRSASASPPSPCKWPSAWSGPSSCWPWCEA